MSFQEKIIKEYKSKGYMVIKHIRCNVNGFPDIQLCKSGVSTFIEVKEGKDDISALQKYTIDRLISQGFNAFCLHDSKGIIYPKDNEDLLRLI